MGAFVDLTGHRFGRLTAVRRAGSKGGCALWFCLCDCGSTVLVQSRYLRSGNTRSCGCIHSEQVAVRNLSGRTDRHKNLRLYGVWRSMKQRCYDKKRKDFPNYGGRGIKVCDEWMHSFSAFCSWAMSNGYDKNASYMACTLDRIDPDGDYEPSNCRWVNAKQQANNRRNSRREMTA